MIFGFCQRDKQQQHKTDRQTSKRMIQRVSRTSPFSRCHFLSYHITSLLAYPSFHHIQCGSCEGLPGVYSTIWCLCYKTNKLKKKRNRRRGAGPVYIG